MRRLLVVVMDPLAWTTEVLPNTHLWGVVFAWVALYLGGRVMARLV